MIYLCEGTAVATADKQAVLTQVPINVSLLPNLTTLSNLNKAANARKKPNTSTTATVLAKATCCKMVNIFL